MTALLFRILLLTFGLAVTELGLAAAIAEGVTLGWAAALLVGVPLLVAGSAGFIAPLLGGPLKKGGLPDA